VTDSEFLHSSFEDDVLRSLRRISRAVDLHSRRLASVHKLTGPQLVCLRQVLKEEGTTPGALARAVSLSQPTVTGIVDRLADRGLLDRRRDANDRRRVLLSPTDAGRDLAQRAPSPLQDLLATNLARLAETDQRRISEMLQQVVRMMEADYIDASPVFATGPMSGSPEQVLNLLDPEGDPADDGS